jgi:Na+-translocating ferredoxin:NAD+ oxidoreductase RnfC subunit
LKLDPSDIRVIQFDWDDEALPAGVTITTSTFTISVIRQSGVTALTKDNPTIVSGSRKTQVRLLATTATAGDKYRLMNTIVTNESPAQTIERQITVLVQNQ